MVFAPESRALALRCSPESHRILFVEGTRHELAVHWSERRTDAILSQRHLCNRLSLPSFAGEFFRIPRGVILIDALMSLVLIGGGRVSIRIFREKFRLLQRHGELGLQKSVVVVGAGDAAEMLVREIARNPHSGLRILALFDDGSGKWGQTLHGIKVMGGVEDVHLFVQDTPVETAIVAIPSANNVQMKEDLQPLSDLNLEVKTLPALHEIIEGSSPLTQIRDVNISDLLGRDEINIDTDQVANLIAGKVVLVTGQEEASARNYAARFQEKPEPLLLMERTENSLFHIHRQLNRASERGHCGPAAVRHDRPFERASQI